MGAPVDTGLENFEEAILKLSVADRIKLIHWISETMVTGEAETVTSPPATNTVEEPASAWPPANMRVAENPSGKEAWHAGIPRAEDLTEEERLEVLDELSGAWKDSTPDDLAEQIISSRTISTREINLDG
ncbi:hypothetical protein [Neolewinella agarilytica]|uniref:Uncharacterized protein n=1 Tax=Neolewinella agarilytica TaxID=478744 RepID=A0A1H9AN88_9BACT|nr:hypothetical protein [Neolewinella agarilytica]SEP78015.1 hypothetical protein SAMN05444359_102158 [Neolewinella agarilytica]